MVEMAGMYQLADNGNLRRWLRLAERALFQITLDFKHKGASDYR